MTLGIRGALLTAFLLACLMLGGASREGHLANFVLQVGGLGCLIWGAYLLELKKLSRLEKMLITLTALGLLIAMLQLVPLPVEMWRKLPGRASIAEELDFLGVLPGPATVTLSLHETIRSLVSIVPAVGLGMLLLSSGRDHAPALSTAIVGVALASLVMGITQVLGGPDSPTYIYDFTNRGYMVGFFANANHMATLLLVSLPFLAALTRDGRKRFPQRKGEITVFAVSLFTLVVIGICLVGSLTGYALLLPVALASVLIVWPIADNRRLLLLGLPILIASAGALALLSELESRFVPDAQTSLSGREMIRSNAVNAAADFFPVGSGLGTFEEVYRRYEPAEDLAPSFIAHAHNDYLEIALELGAPGMILIILLLGWWVACIPGLILNRASPYAWAGWITVGIILVHSGWDYPLRTSALAAIFALGCVLAARTDPKPAVETRWAYQNHR